MIRKVCMLAALLPLAAHARAPVNPVAPPYTCPVNRYVDATLGNDANDGLALANGNGHGPWKTIGNADDGWPNTPAAGECVNVNDGLYQLAGTMIFSHGGNLNTPTGYVVYRAIHPGKVHVQAAPGFKSGNGDLVMLWAAYITIDGLEIDGNKSLAGGAGIDGCANGGWPGNIAHHMIVLNSSVHDVGGAGISTCSADFVGWDNNDVYRTSSTNLYQDSGLDIWEPKALAPGSYTPTAYDNIPYHILVSNSHAHNSIEGPSIPVPHTDGNGIIVDTTVGSANCPNTATPYPGTILVEYNVANNNGGGGIHVFLSANVIVANNTAYGNYQDPLNPGTARGDLSNGGSTNVSWVNNIGYAVPGAGPLAKNVPAIDFSTTCYTPASTWTATMTYGAGVTIPALSNYPGVNPMLWAPASGDFGLMPGSPAIGSGLPEPYLDTQNAKRTFIGALGVRQK